MKMLDANIMLYAYDRSSAHHRVCRTWLEAAFNGDELVALPWQTLLAFVRLSTNPRVVRQPVSGEAACAIVGQWLAYPNITVPDPAGDFWNLFRTQVSEAQVKGPLVTDAALAALALECGAVLCTTDRDFRRFRSLRLENPLEQ
jgi:toxin-antitoxin system PIN domain toxin